MGNNNALIQEIYQTVNTIGESETIKALRVARINQTAEETCQSIAKKIFNHFSRPTNQIANHQIKEKDEREKRAIAIGFCVFVLSKKCGIKYRIINQSLQLGYNTRSGLAYYYNIIAKAKLNNPKSPIDKIVAENMLAINNIANQHSK